MDEREQQPSRQPREAATRAADRLAQLRADARRSNHLRYLLDDDFSPPPVARRPVPWLMIAAGAAVVASLAGVGALVLGGGSGGPGMDTYQFPASQTSETLLAGAPTSAPTRSAARTTATPSATGTVTDGGTPEGAVEAALVLAEPPPPPNLTTPARTSLRVAGKFGAPRGDGLVHSGLDLELPGSGGAFQVTAACSGRVIAVAEQAGFGNFTVVDCRDGWRAVYANMDSIAVTSGQQVDAGESVIGGVRQSLHFELRHNNRPLDPEPFINFLLPAGANLTPTPEPTETPSPTSTPSSTPTRAAATRTPAGGAPGETPEPPAPTATAVPPASTPVPPTPTPAPPTPTPAPPTATPTRTPRPPTPVPTLGPPIR